MLARSSCDMVPTHSHLRSDGCDLACTRCAQCEAPFVALHLIVCQGLLRLDNTVQSHQPANNLTTPLVRKRDRKTCSVRLHPCKPRPAKAAPRAASSWCLGTFVVFGLTGRCLMLVCVLKARRWRCRRGESSTPMLLTAVHTRKKKGIGNGGGTGN